MDKLESNIDYAWERFYLDKMRLSRPALFAKAEEIVLMREIRDTMKDLLNDLTPEQITKLLLEENALETAYRYVLDYRTRFSSTKDLISAYLRT